MLIQKGASCSSRSKLNYEYSSKTMQFSLFLIPHGERARHYRSAAASCVVIKMIIDKIKIARSALAIMLTSLRPRDQFRPTT
jgi:hypothetical protein